MKSEPILAKILHVGVKHLVSFSGGKDSTAMLLRMLEENWPVDEIVFIDTGKEFPEMYSHITKVQKYIGREVVTLKSEKEFGHWMFDYIRVKGSWAGVAGYGWPHIERRWCTEVLKRRVYLKYIKYYSNPVEYHGITSNEKRVVSKRGKRNIKYPLIGWGMSENDTLHYCYTRGFDWDGLYERFKRVSCWCCPLKSLPELRNLYLYYPELWRELKDMDLRANNQFKQNWSVAALERYFITGKK